MAQQVVALHDLPTLVGSSFTSDAFRVPEEDRLGFEHSTWIDQIYPADYDETVGYPDGMIEGFHTLAMLDYAIHTMLRVDPDAAFGYNYGLDKVRFPSSITSSDDLVLTMTVAAVTPRGEGYLVSYDCRIAVPGAAKPAMTAEWLALVLPRAAA